MDINPLFTIRSNHMERRSRTCNFLAEFDPSDDTPCAPRYTLDITYIGYWVLMPRDPELGGGKKWELVDLDIISVNRVITIDGNEHVSDMDVPSIPEEQHADLVYLASKDAESNERFPHY